MIIIILSGGIERQFHGTEIFKQANEMFTKNRIGIAAVQMLYADGDEYQSILRLVDHMPHSTSGVGRFTWYGDLARTILLNI
ncbi:MAG: hypothetical protein WC525_07525 [Candidatus Thermoplasmatota archaeon]